MHRRSFRFDEARAGRADRFAAELAGALRDLRLTHKALDLGATHHTVDSSTREETNFQRLCALLEERKPGLGKRGAAAAGSAWQHGAAEPGRGPVPPRLVGQALAARSALAAFREQTERAARLAGAAEALLKAAGLKLTPPFQAEYDINLARIRNSLADPTVRAVWKSGSAMMADQAVTYASGT